MIILAEISDLHSVLGVNEVYYIDSKGARKSIRDISLKSNIALVINSGESEPSKKELEKTSTVYFEEIPYELPPLAYVSILLYLLSSLL